MISNVKEKKSSKYCGYFKREKTKEKKSEKVHTIPEFQTVSH